MSRFSSRLRSLVNPWGWRPLLALWGALLAGLIGFRIAFLLRYQDAFTGIPPADVALALLHGLRFDLAAIFAFTGLPAVAALLLSPLPGGRWVYWLLLAWSAVVGLAFAALSAIDLGYYGYVARRVSFEVVEMRQDWRPITSMILRGYALQTAAVLVGLALVLGLGAWGYARLLARPRGSVRPLSHLAQAALLFLLTVLIVRGGVQSKPLSVGMAFLGPHMALGHLTLNPVFTAIAALWRNQPTHLDFTPEDQAEARTRALLGLHGPPQDVRYPLLRDPAIQPAQRPRNLVILTVESFSAQFTGPLGGTRGLTPNFDKLAQEGLLFSNFHAAGTRSLEGIASILAGFPALPTHTLIGSAAEQTRLHSLPLILHEHGYASMFLHGAFRGSMWFDTFAARQGFDRYIAKEDFPDAEHISDSYWGVFDHFVLERLHAELEAAPRPVFGFYFSLSPHTPYDLPDERFRRFGAEHPQAELHNAVAYADASLGRFFEQARHSTYWKDTIFVVTADHHLGGDGLDPRSRMWIPLLILVPGDPDFPRGVVNHTLGSQVDIAPTLLELLGLDAPHAFAGQSLLRPAEHRFALLGWGSSVGWLTPDWLLTHDLERPLALFDRRADPALRSNLLRPGMELPPGAGLADLRAYLQTLNNLLVDNRLAPAAVAQRPTSPRVTQAQRAP